MADQNQDSFVNDLQSTNFQIALEIFKKQQIQNEGKNDYQDLFLMEQIFPVLLEALERLSREVEQYLQQKEEIDIEVRKRFNPCIFLAQFLMRNNPKHNQDKKELPSYKEILIYARQERFNRFFENKKSIFIKNFMKSTKKDKTDCDLQELRTFIKEVDEKTNQNGKLSEYFLACKSVNKMKKEIHFDVILAQIIKYCTYQAHLTPDVFADYLA